MRAALYLSCAALLAAGPVQDAAAIVRCEAADGKVTYSNTECPPNSKATRKVDLSPAVVSHEGKAPTKDAERQPLKIEAGKPKPPADPAREDQELTAQIAAQRRECDERARQLQHLQADLDAATGESRSSAELALRRAQEDYRGLCARRR
jgi:hypothetical protein